MLGRKGVLTAMRRSADRRMARMAIFVRAWSDGRRRTMESGRSRLRGWRKGWGAGGRREKTMGAREKYECRA